MQVWDDHDGGNKFTSIIRRNTGYPYSFDCGNIALSGGCVQEMDCDSEDLGPRKGVAGVAIANSFVKIKAVSSATENLS